MKEKAYINVCFFIYEKSYDISYLNMRNLKFIKIRKDMSFYNIK